MRALQNVKVNQTSPLSIISFTRSRTLVSRAAHLHVHTPDAQLTQLFAALTSVLKRQLLQSLSCNVVQRRLINRHKHLCAPCECAWSEVINGLVGCIATLYSNVVPRVRLTQQKKSCSHKNKKERTS